MPTTDPPEPRTRPRRTEAGGAARAILVGLAVLGVFLLTAAAQLRVPTQILTVLLAIVVGAAAVTVALAFGLGGRPTAHKLLEQWTEANRMPTPPVRPRAPTPPDNRQPPLV